MLRFKKIFKPKSVICTIRESKGLDISAACGQLKREGSKWEFLKYRFLYLFNCSYCLALVLYTK